MEEAKLGLVKRIVYAFTCLFGSKEEINEILLSNTDKEVLKEEKEPLPSIKEEKFIQEENKPTYTLGIMDRFCLIKVDGELLEGFVSILSKENHPVVKQNLVILNLKNMIDKEIFFENTDGYGKISSLSEEFVVVTMDNYSTQSHPNVITTFKFEPEIIYIQSKDIGVLKSKKGDKVIDSIGVNMNAIKDSYLRWTKEWPLISSMIKKN